MNEQENKFKESETSITALHVNVVPRLPRNLYSFIIFLSVLEFLNLEGRKLNFKNETKMTVLAKFLE